MKKVRIKNLRQGQTVYEVWTDWSGNYPSVKIREIFLHSQKEPLPPEGCIVKRMPVSELKIIMKIFGYNGLFFSRRKALSYQTQIKRMI